MLLEVEFQNLIPDMFIHVHELGDGPERAVTYLCARKSDDPFFSCISLLLFHLFDKILQGLIFVDGQHMFHSMAADVVPDENGFLLGFGRAFP